MVLVTGTDACSCTGRQHVIMLTTAETITPDSTQVGATRFCHKITDLGEEAQMQLLLDNSACHLCSGSLEQL